MNQNGTWDAGEPGMAGWRVYLDMSNTGQFDPQSDPSTVTGSDGSYIFANLTPGTYHVRFVSSDLSDGTFSVMKSPAGGEWTVTAALGHVVSGTAGQAGSPNFGMFNYSPFIRPADNIFAQIDQNHDGSINAGETSLSQFQSLLPWQTFSVTNSTSAAFTINNIDESQITAPGDGVAGSQLLRILEKQAPSGTWAPLQLPISVSPDNSAEFLVFFDPAIRDNSGNVLEQFPDWYGSAAKNCPPYTFGPNDHLTVVTSNPAISVRVNLVGGSTYDSDIFYDGAVDNLDFTRLNSLLDEGYPVLTNSRLFTSTADINVRYANGAMPSNWPEIGLGDFAPLNVEYNSARGPFLDLDPGNTSGRRGGDYVANFAVAATPSPVPIVGPGASFANFSALSLSSLTVTITNLADNSKGAANEVLAADTSGTSIVQSYNSATGVLTLSGTDTVDDYNQVLRTITYVDNAADPNFTPRIISFSSIGDGSSFARFLNGTNAGAETAGNTAATTVYLVTSGNSSSVSGASASHIPASPPATNSARPMAAVVAPAAPTSRPAATIAPVAVATNAVSAKSVSAAAVSATKPAASTVRTVASAVIGPFAGAAMTLGPTAAPSLTGPPAAPKKVSNAVAQTASLAADSVPAQAGPAKASLSAATSSAHDNVLAALAWGWQGNNGQKGAGNKPLVGPLALRLTMAGF